MALIDHFPAAILILRDRIDLSQRVTADRVRQRTGAPLTQSMLSQWERGTQRPSLESLASLLDGLGFSLADLHLAIVEAEEAARTEEKNPAEAEAEILDQVRSRLRAEPAFRGSLLAHLLEPVETTPSLNLLGQEIGDLRQALDERMQALEKQLAQLLTA